ncbi:neurobeachin [Anaeramoeba ignava]|uniref:Neurobeachin n=1 Tax=Anaeramoeba ignava TaxID=1746090 RepID=A0A9Q0LP34_ANAIG|nr:neurobeachin [Anaeramoeba ignava]
MQLKRMQMIFLSKYTNITLEYHRYLRNTHKILSFKKILINLLNKKIFISNLKNPKLQKWQRHEMTNFDYLMELNTFAGRSFHDTSQCIPFFPWIISDYKSERY